MKTRVFLGGCCLLLANIAFASTDSMQLGTATDYSTFDFVPNAGQFRADVAFVARTRSKQIFVLTDGRIVHALPVANTRSGSAISAWVVLEALPGAVPAAPAGTRYSAQHVTWLTAAGSRPILDAKAFSALEWREAWPGIDMQLQIVDDRTERVFRVAPGADWKRIALAYDGVRFESEASGGLIARAGEGVLTLSAPIAFQDKPGGRVPVDVRYVVQEQGTRVSFEVGTYDDSQPLTIDPVLQTTYFSFGGRSSLVTDMTVDSATGDVIVAGISNGLGNGVLPGLAGGFQTFAMTGSGFVARIDAKLRRVIQSTLFGQLMEGVATVAVHPQSGEIYVAGTTAGLPFPGTGGGAREDSPAGFGGVSGDGFITRFSADLRSLLQSTFTNQESVPVKISDMAISSTTGEIYVAGGPSAAFVLRFNRQLTAQLSRAVLEGSAGAAAHTIALNQSTGDVYVAGLTSSRVFPLTAGGAEPTFREGGDFPVFIARFNADLSQHLQSTFLSDVFAAGGFAFSVRPVPLLAVHPVSGELYVAGDSGRSDLPATAGNAQSTYGGGQTDIVVSRLSPDLTQRRGATYFGGSGLDALSELSFTPDGVQLYLTGVTQSTNLPGTPGGAIPVLPNPIFSGWVARLSASLSTLHRASYFYPVDPVNPATAQALAIHPATGEVYLGGQCTAGLAELAGGLQPFYDGALTSFGTSCIARLDSQLAGGNDVDADTFSFTDQFAVAAGVDVTSAPVRIEGITVPVTTSVSNGVFNIDGGPYEATPREVRRGQSIRVRHTASALAGASTDTVLSVGSGSDTFTSVTATGADSSPDPFAFAPRDPVATSIVVASDPVAIGGIDQPAPIAVANGEYSIDGGAFSSAPGTINGGQTVVVRHTSANTPATNAQTTLTIGGLTAQFISTTDPLDDTVHPISLRDEVRATPDAELQSTPIVVIGVNVPVPVSVVGAEWTTDGINFQSGPGIVENKAVIVLRRRSGPPGTTVTATLTVGDQSDDWVIGQPLAGDTTPDAFSFAAQTNIFPLSYAISNEIIVSGINVPVWIDAGSGAFLDPVSGLYLAGGFIANGAHTRIRVRAGAFAGDLTLARVRIGTSESTFEVRTSGGDLTPDPFDFVDQTGVAAGAQVISNEVTVSGLVGPVQATVSGCELSINGDPFSAAAIQVSSGVRLRLRAVASTTAGATVTCSLNIGGVTDQFRVTTAGSSGGGGGGGSSGGGGGGAIDWLALVCMGAFLLAGARRRMLAAVRSEAARAALPRTGIPATQTRQAPRRPPGDDVLVSC